LYKKGWMKLDVISSRLVIHGNRVRNIVRNYDQWFVMDGDLARIAMDKDLATWADRLIGR
jgi:hypothetical protein